MEGVPLNLRPRVTMRQVRTVEACVPFDNEYARIAHDNALCVAMESRLLCSHLIAPSVQRANDLGVPIHVIANLTQGGYLLRNMEHVLDDAGVVHYSEKVSSNCLYDDVFRILRESTAGFVQKEHIVVVLDTTRDNTPIGHVPQAYRGYRDYIELLNRREDLSISPYSFVVYNKGANYAYDKNGAIERPKEFNADDTVPLLEFSSGAFYPIAELFPPVMVFANGALAQRTGDALVSSWLKNGRRYVSGACDAGAPYYGAHYFRTDKLGLSFEAYFFEKAGLIIADSLSAPA